MYMVKHREAVFFISSKFLISSKNGEYEYIFNYLPKKSIKFAHRLMASEFYHLIEKWEAFFSHFYYHFYFFFFKILAGLENQNKKYPFSFYLIVL